MSKILYIRFKKDEQHLKAELEKIAEKESRTVVSVVRQAIKEFLEKKSN